MSAELEIIEILIILGWVSIAISILIITVQFIKPSNFKYRKFVTDIFVTGKIRQIADKEGVDLDKEYLEFLKYNNLHKGSKRKEIDIEIEEKFSDEISNTVKKEA